ncbi:uncharacterized protein LOC124267994 [Haliotis rubra]|uniref:uncharacterized protein LOC124267994 n=1 Tax=Haliotis rubra TaxID=36100 RepID=UPI001EE5A0FA|nr:uncharacterized protein LOC124267994 [Haliotis rubra]
MERKVAIDRQAMKFVDDSVCGPKTIDLAFSNLCHRDDWFVAYVVVEYKDMATGDRDRVKFKANYWLSATEEHEHTTGISCYHMVSAGILSSMLIDIKCHPSQKCEH